MPKKRLNLLLLALGIVPLLFWTFQYINVDLWYDEVYSLQNFVLTSLSDTLFTYPLPNNHVFFNLTSQIISRLFGIRNINSLAENVWVFRLFQLFITIAIAIYTVKICRQIFKLEFYFLSLVILFTCIPFLNFSLQLRGYNLSSLFFIMLLFHSWKFIKDYGKYQIPIIITTSLLLLYTIPSNIYLLVTLLLIITMIFGVNIRRKSIAVKKYKQLILFISSGILLAIILYLPILKDIVSNKFASQTNDDVFHSLKLIPQLSTAFLSKRFFLVPLVFGGIYLLVRQSDQDRKNIYLVLISIFLIPFILSFFHQKLVIDRVFIPLNPVFTLIVVIPIAYLFQFIKNRNFFAFVSVIFAICCLVNFYFEKNKIGTQVESDLLKLGQLDQSIYQNYYLADIFQPENAISSIIDKYRHLPIYMYKQMDYPSNAFYLAVNGLNYTYLEKLEELETKFIESDSIVVLTSLKAEVLNETRNFDKIKSQTLTTINGFTNVILLQKK